VFFGINMKCASCHDSFIDTWKLNDAYGLAAIIADAPLEIHRCDKPTGAMAVPKFLWPELGSIDPNLPKGERLARLAELVTHSDNGRFARTIVNRLWQRLMGRGIVHPVDIMANEPWSEDLLEELAVYLVDHKYDLKALIEHIVSSEAYQSRTVPLKSENAGDDYVYRGPEVKRMSAEQFFDAVWTITHTGPTRPDAPIKPASARTKGKDRARAEAKKKADAPSGTVLVRASMVKSNPLMRSLGRPNREQVVTIRGDVLTTLQALDLSNGQVLADAVAQGAAKLLKANPGLTTEERVEALYLQALCRPPTAAERASAVELVGDPATPERLSDLLWVIFVLPEFQLIR
jgi:hypothetical protein